MAEMKEILVANLTLDTTRRNNIPPLIVPQGDYGARVIKAKITVLGKPVTVPNTASVSIVADRNGDGEALAFSGKANEDGSVTVPVTQWMLDVPESYVTCHIEATGIDYKYSTTHFLIEPEKKANPTEIAPDDPRQDLVTEVLAGENTRRAAEEERVSNENARIAAENARQSAETQRLTDEATRITNEAQRVSAEASRDATFKSWAQDIASLPTFDGRISANRKRIENLESGIPAESFIIDDRVAYTKDAPENVAPNAVVTKLGGMTYKNKNLWSFGDKTFSWYDWVSVNMPAGSYSFGALITSDNTGDSRFLVLFANAAGQSVGVLELKPNIYNSGVVTLTAEATTIRLYAGKDYYTAEGHTATYTNIMLNEGSTALPYEPYFEGLRSAKVTEVKSVGANLSSVNSASLQGSDYVFIKKFPTPLEPGAYTVSFKASNYEQYSKFSMGFERSSGQEFAGSATDLSDNASLTITANEKIYGVYVYCNSTTGLEATEIMLNKGSTAQPYTPYVEHTLPIPEAVRPANGINENVYDYIEWADDGSVKKAVKCGVVDLGTLDWYYGDLYGVGINCLYTYGIKDAKLYNGMGTPNALCAIYNSITPREMSLGESGITLYDTLECIAVLDSNYTDAATFKAAMSGVMLVYELAEPIITDISDLITADNLVPVQSGGTMTHVNEYGYAVPSTIIYQSR